MKLLIDLNTLRRKHISKPDGSLDLAKLDSLRGDGVLTLGMANTENSFSEQELRQVHLRLGLGHVVTEDGCFQTHNFRGVRDLLGAVTVGISYYETWMLNPPFNVPGESTPCLSLARVQWVLDDIKANSGYDAGSIAVLTRDYDGPDVRTKVDACIADQRVCAIAVEMWPDAGNLTAFRLDELTKKVLDAGKRLYFILAPRPTGLVPGSPEPNYLTEMRKFVAELRKTNRLNDQRLYLVPANYNDNKPWFGSDDSVEAAMLFLKQQAEWNSEWPLTNADGPSVEPGWPPRQLIDGNTSTPWSSVGTTVANTRVEVSVWWDGFRPVNYVRLRPRWDHVRRRALAFPVDFHILYSNGSEWKLAWQAANFPAPGKDDWITLDLPETQPANGIQIVATKLGKDNFGSYFFQLMEVSAGFARSFKAAKVGARPRSKKAVTRKRRSA